MKPLLAKTCKLYVVEGPDLQNILRQSYNYLTIMQKLRSTYDVCLIYQTSYKERKAFLGYDFLAKSQDHLPVFLTIYSSEKS